MATILGYGKSSWSRKLSYPVIGSAFGVIAVIGIVKTPIDMHQESKQAKWPTVVATITQQAVRREKTYRWGYDWHIETEARYAVDGEELKSSIHSRLASSDQERDMYRWVSEHPPGTSLPIRYDPQHHNTVVPVPGDMPMSGSEVPGDLAGSLIFSILSITLLTIGRVRQSRKLKRV